MFLADVGDTRRRSQPAVPEPPEKLPDRVVKNGSLFSRRSFRAIPSDSTISRRAVFLGRVHESNKSEGDRMAATKRKLVVCGGTGFLGSRICKSAVTRNWEVISLSRSGQPSWSAITSSPSPPGWASSVRWEKADILRPSTYAPFLKDADSVVHSMGILLEADYKGVLQGKESLFSGLSRAFSSRKGGSSKNPLEREADEDLESEETDGQLTYELMNRDSAIALAQEAVKAGVKDYVFISAAGGAPILPERYITSKRQAEATIEKQLPQLRPVFMRPGFLYDSSRLYTVALAYPTFPVSALNWALGGRLSKIGGAAVAKPLKADDVASAVVEALEDGNIRGPVQIEQIEELATRAWRKTML